MGATRVRDGGLDAAGVDEIVEDVGLDADVAAEPSEANAAFGDEAADEPLRGVEVFGCLLDGVELDWHADLPLSARHRHGSSVLGGG
jgi:hypothetical protein